MPVASKTIRELLENGVHFGHQTNKWNPKMKKFIFGKKSGIYIIDLEKTEEALQKAVDFVYDLSRKGGKVLFVGTKKQAKYIIKEEAQRCGMFYVDERWLGGCLTNFNTIRKSVDRLDHLQETKKSEIYTSLAKKERVQMDREEEKLLKNLKGIRDMKDLPSAIIIIDSDAENIAVLEAKKLGIPVIALLDTNSDPDIVDFPIPGNDDAIKSINYICTTLADAVLKGSNEFNGTVTPVKAQEETADGEEEPQEETAPGGQQEEPAGSPDDGLAEEDTGEERPQEEPTFEEEEPSEEDEDKTIDGDISLG